MVIFINVFLSSNQLILPFLQLDGDGLVLVSRLLEACEFVSLELVLGRVDAGLLELEL